MTAIHNAVAKAIREEIIRQYRDDDRSKCPNGIPFWEEEVQPILLAEVAISAYRSASFKPYPVNPYPVWRDTF